MKSKVFVSCGQHGEEETRIASEIADMLTRRGFQPYIAKEVQTIFEINSGIIKELKDSDCYLFVNFQRERLGEGEFRGSLFSNQEFAIAYALGFERILVVNQKHIRPEGMLRYIGCNTDDFDGHSDCLAAVERALDRAGWKPDYSRRLRAGETRLSEIINYTSSHIQLTGRFLYLNIHNGRPDIAALEATARLASYWPAGSDTKMPSRIRSVLKATGKPGFSHTIFPKSHEAFDLLCIGESPYARGVERVYLNSALDLIPTPDLPITKGTWEMQYEFYAIDFPLLTVVIELAWPDDGPPSARVLREDLS